MSMTKEWPQLYDIKAWLTLTEQELKHGGLETIEIGSWAIYLRWAAMLNCYKLSAFKHGGGVFDANFTDLAEAHEAARRVERDAAIDQAMSALGVKYEIGS